MDMPKNISEMPNRPRHAAFTLVEILIVVVILGILAVIAVPKMSNASQTAKESTLKDQMRYLRTQITVYGAQHNDVFPGYAAGNVSNTPDAASFANQLTEYTDSVGNVSATAGAAYSQGPYLNQIPPDPINGLTSIEMAPPGSLTPDGTTGWLYQASTGTLMPNVLGNDSNGKPYSSY